MLKYVIYSHLGFSVYTFSLSLRCQLYSQWNSQCLQAFSMRLCCRNYDLLRLKFFLPMSLYFQIVCVPQGRLRRPKSLWKFPPSFSIGSNPSSGFLTSHGCLHFTSACSFHLVSKKFYSAYTVPERTAFTSGSLEEKTKQSRFIPPIKFTI